MPPKRGNPQESGRSQPDPNILPFNPLQPEYIAEIASQELLRRPCYSFAELPSFEGAGIYAIYYHGNSPYYQPVSDLNREGCVSPIYVGKADPPGARRGTAVVSAGPALYNRLRQHAESLRQASQPGTPEDLDIKDFKVRFLVMDRIWIGMTESLTIAQFRPPWNGYIDGFGHHDQGATRRTQERSKWDTLHPGRPWATRFKSNRLSVAEIAQELTRYYADPATFHSAPRRRGPVTTEEAVEVELDQDSGDDTQE